MNKISERKNKKTEKTLSQKLDEAEKKQRKLRMSRKGEEHTISPYEEMTAPYTVIGFILRAFTMFVGVLGLNLFLFDAVRIVMLGGGRAENITVEFNYIVVVCVICTLAIMLLSLTRLTYALTPFAAVGAAAVYLFASYSDPVGFVVQAFRRLVELVIENLGDIGYTTYMQYISGQAYSYDEETLLRFAVGVIILFSSTVIGMLMSRRVKAVGVGIVCAVYMIPVFMFNITKTNTGLAFTLIFICGSVAMYISDCLYGGIFEARKNKKAAKKERKENKRTAKKAKKTSAEELKTNAIKAYNSAIERGMTKSDAKKARESVYSAAEKKRLDKIKAEKEQKEAAKASQIEEKLRLKEEKAKARAEIKQKKSRIATLAKSKSQSDLEEAEKLKSEIKEYGRNARREKNLPSVKRAKVRASSGFAGGMAMLVAALAVWIPYAAVSKNFPIIDVINNKMQLARTYVTAYLMGDDIDLNSLSMYGGVAELNPRSVDFNTPQYTGQKLFSVDVGYNAPVYMRSWIGSNYSLESDSWSSADSDAVLEYRARFGNSYSPDNITYFFNKYVHPTAIQLDKLNQYRNLDDYGFRVFQVHVKRVSGNSRIIFVPSIMNPEHGIMDYNSTEPTTVKYSAYYDGIYSSRFFNESVDYSVFSSNPVMKDENLAENLEGSISYYMLCKKYADAIDSITKEISAMTETDENVVSTFETVLGDITIIGNDLTPMIQLFEEDVAALGYRYSSQSFVEMYLEMTSGERKQFIKAFNSELNYRDYTEETYRTTLGSDSISSLAMQILEDNGIVMGEKTEWDKSYLETMSEKAIEKMTAEEKYGNNYESWFTYADSGETVPRHEVIMAVINYLRENYTYTLEPNCPQKELLDEDGNAVLDENGEPVMIDDIKSDSNLEAFLFEVKEGYCVHFATSALALLREMGFAVRYDEGYIASGFSKTYDKEKAANYRTSVRDYDAHAWIEVYYPAIGWMTYECTPSYCEIMYDTESSTQSTTSGIDTSKVTVRDNTAVENTESDVALITEDEVDYTLVIVVISVVVGVYVVLTVVWAVLKKRAKKAENKRIAMINTALDEDGFMSGKTDVHSTARFITDAVFDILSALGMPPEKGELPTEYATRIDGEYKNISSHRITDVMQIIEKEEFGGKLTYRELCVLAEYLKDIESSVYSSLPVKEKFRMRYIMNVI